MNQISDNSRRIARNTVYLYIRMLVMMVIGLVTYRVIFRALGVSDYGVYSAVGGVVTMFMLVMGTVNSAVMRYITVGLGKGDPDKLRTVFWTSVVIMAAFSALIVLLTETLGLWYLHNKMVIPDGRMGAAEVVLHSSAAIMMISLLTVPYQSVITAHEHMSAYAYISICEAVIKLAIAFLVASSGADKLVTYALCLMIASILVRGSFVLYCYRHFDESHGPVRYDLSLVKEMGAYAGWNFLGSGAHMLNTQGVNQLMNIFFGVGVNAARGVADKVDQVVRQFATNIAFALNPQLTKSYVSGNKEYSFSLVCKGSKYYFWVLWVLIIPFLTDAETILRLWIVDYPPQAAIFTRLALLCFLIDFTPATLNTLEQANGRLRRYYLITSGIAVSCFVFSLVAYKLGAPSWSAYVIYLAVYVLKAAAMLLVAHCDTGFPVRLYLRTAVLPMFAVIVPSLLAVSPLYFFAPQAWWRFIAAAVAGVVSSAAGIWLCGLSDGEKQFILSKVRRG
ncbi:MAG: lipopolysaccharide biosynthesis protein [Bacteroidales bacterium]|nr:lipopolysaccharide biosynthesis protein [Bacteroidales bacterium]